MLNFRVFRVVFSVFVLTSLYSSAQSIEEVQKVFPGEYVAVLNYNRDMKIYMKNNLPVAETREEMEILVLDDRANGVYNKYKVYHGTFDELKDLEAYTKVPDGARFKKIKVVDVRTEDARSSSVFFDDMKESVFNFPSLMKGAIANVGYSEFHKDPHLLTPFYFTGYMPVLKARFTVTFPSSMQVRYILKNNDDKKIQFKEENKGKQTTYEFTASTLKPKDYYSDGPSRSFYEPHVIVHISSYKNDQGELINYLGNVDDLYKWDYSFLKNINNLPSDIIKHLADSLTTGLDSEQEKTKQIYKWVQENIKYVAFEQGLEGFVPRLAADVCTKRYGDCKDMASLLTALLNQAGIKAYFTWIGTRDIPYDYNEVPLPLTDNHMISSVSINGDWIFLDATDPNCIFGSPSQGIQGKQAMISISENDYKIIRVPVLELDKSYVIDSTFITITEQGIMGKSSVYYNGYFGVDAFNHLLYKDTKDVKDYVKERITKGNNKFILGDYSINKVSSADKIVKITSRFEVPDYGKKISDELYINLNLDRSYNTNLIDTSRRKVALDNNFKFRVKNYTILEIPQGYEVSYLPENYNYKNDLFAFNISYVSNNGKIVASQELNSNCMLLQPKEFSKWNEAMKELSNQYKKQLVLKKK